MERGREGEWEKGGQGDKDFATDETETIDFHGSERERLGTQDRRRKTQDTGWIRLMRNGEKAKDVATGDADTMDSRGSVGDFSLHQAGHFLGARKHS